MTGLILLAAALLDTIGEWPAYGRDPGGQRFSPLALIHRDNVKSLEVAWTFHTGDAYQPKNSRATAFEATPLFIEGTLYLSTPLGRVLALDPVTGAQRWAFDPKVDRDKGYGDFANRGVSAWKSPKGQLRILVATIDARLISIDAATGKPCADFGDNGSVNLRIGLRIPPKEFSDYEETSPPTVVGNTVVVGSGIADNQATDQPSGEVRGFDAATGKLKWTWDPLGSKSRTGAANSWTVMAADPNRNLVFVSTSSASPDYYGGERPGDNLYANSLIALRADTGRRVWHFQTVHHDLWDYDVASPPILFDVRKNGKRIPAVGVGSKTGNFFVLNRESGKPVFGVEERPVPKSDVPGETAAPTQPFPKAPRPLVPQKLDPDDIWGADESDRNWCRAEISRLRNEGIFTPPSLGGTLVVPGNIGGMAWGGAAYDADDDLLIIPTNRLAAQVRLIPRAAFEKERSAGRSLGGDWEFAPQRGTPYGMARRFLLSPGRHLPCNHPPWGTLTAVSASTGEVKWESPIGRFMGTEKVPKARAWGSISLGGPIATHGGLIFMAGTLDPAIYAFDARTGAELWRGALPTSARSTPMTFRAANGRQYVVVCAGGHGIAGASPLGDSVVAFTIP
ncbi:MAG TPA: pyrroloquinoline quinone-dependent dehydrogenase [Bryobacteraceae bacterium]|nr:pyrroloquinoline quinone-dependent dehydrogenase [Bryobacteraceae bacterium]